MILYASNEQSDKMSLFQNYLLNLIKQCLVQR